MFNFENALKQHKVETWGYTWEEMLTKLSPKMKAMVVEAAQDMNREKYRALVTAAFDAYKGMKATSETGELMLDGGFIIERMGYILIDWGK